MCKGNLFRLFLGLSVYFCKNVAETAATESISVVGQTEPMIEGTWYELRCHIQNVVPDQLLTVGWYKGQTLLTSKSFNDTAKTPVTKTATYWISPNITDNGTQYWCEAELRLGSAGLQPPPPLKSDPLVVTVECNCGIVVQPPSVVVEHGSNVLVNCSTSLDHNGMGWEAPQGQVDRTKNVQLLTWNVPRLEEWDIKPICYIRVNDGTMITRFLPVIIYKAPDSVSVDFVGHAGPVIEGQLYKLQCNIQNVAPVQLLTMKWYKGQTLLTETFFNNSIKTPVNQSATHRILPSRADNGVQYWCEAELRLGPAGPRPPPTLKSDPINMIVHYGPEISNCPEHVWLKEGENLEGYCSVTGNPLPEPSWLREGQAIDPNLPLSRTEIGHNYTMYIDSDIQRQLTVFVMYGPEISCTNHITVAENEEVDPKCTAAGYPPPEITWLKEVETVNFPRRMQRTDAGKYTLVASNNATANHTLEIEVLYPPSDIMELIDQSVTQRSSVGLKCASSARPRPEYQWIYHHQPNVRIVNEDGVSMLLIANASGHNIGTYTCIARNGLGEKHLSVRVDVQGAKVPCPLVMNPSRVALEYRESVEVECNASVLPVDLHWEFLNQRVNNRILLVNSSQFKNWNERPSCIGQFVGLGNCTKKLNITVYKTPDSVFMYFVNHTGPVTKGREYELRCDIQNVAPVQLLTVKWYKGQTLLTETFFNNSIKTPVNQSATHWILPNINDDGVVYRCEAELSLGSTGPQLPPVSSDPVRITLHYKPVINKMKLPPVVPVFWGYPEVLVCEAEGRPPPVISWTSGRAQGGNLTITEATNENSSVYNCTATNSAGTDIVSVRVVMKVASCPIVLTPPVVVVEYGASISVDCSTSIAHRGMGWEASQGKVDMRDDVQLLTWSVPRLVEWDIKPFCHININKAGLQCRRTLTVNIYKTPDKVSISTLGHTGPMTEGRQYRLQCYIQNVAPVRLFTVKWYKGPTLVAKTSISDHTETPVNHSTRFQIVPSRDDDGARYRCEAELDLTWDSTGTHRAPRVSSSDLSVTVHYSPEASRLVEIFDESSKNAMLNCTVMANPPPWYSWSSTNMKREFNQGLPLLSSSSLSSGNYTCTASNSIGTIRKLFVVKAKPKGGKRSTFWAIVGSFVGLAVVLIVGYVLRLRIGKNGAFSKTC